MDMAQYALPLEFNSDQAPSRHEKSLGLLTTKFVSLLQEAKDGVLDLKVVCFYFFLIQSKERLYLVAFVYPEVANNVHFWRCHCLKIT